MKLFVKYYLLVFVLFFFDSCKNTKQQDSDILIRSLANELERSSEKIKQGNTAVYRELMAKVYDPITKDKAEIWNAKVLQVQKISDSLILYLFQFKTGNEPEWPAITERYKKTLADYRLVEQEFGQKFNEEFQAAYRSIDTVNLIQHLAKNNTGIRIALLNTLECEIRRLENNTILFCRNHFTDHSGDRFDVESVLVGQSANHLKKGDVLTISAGVGAYSSKADPTIIIDGKNMKVVDALATAKIKVNETPGKHFKVVRLNYTGLDNQPKSFKVNVEYTIDKD